MRQIRVHGQDRRYHHPVIGVNGRIDTLQAAVLLAKLEVFEEEVAARGRIGARYSELLRGHVTTPHLAPQCTSVYAQYTVRTPERDSMVESMRAAGVPTAIHYPTPLHMQPAFADLRLGRGSFSAAESAARDVLSLPMHPYLNQGDQDTIATALLAYTSGEA